jgi:hypothetical protein
MYRSLSLLISCYMQYAALISSSINTITHYQVRQPTSHMIKFKFQLNAQYFIPIVMLLYMFRAPLDPSSGGPLYIYNIWFYVSLFWWPCSWKVSEGLLCSATCFGHFCAHPQEDLCIFTTSSSMSVSFGDRAVGRLVRDCSVPLHVSGTFVPILRRTSVYLQHLVLYQSLLVTVQLEG